MKITDLEKFALEHIFRPYQNMTGFGYKRLKSLPMILDAIPAFAKQHPEWWNNVICRLAKLELFFPYYINHRLVDFIFEQLLLNKKGAAALTVRGDDNG